MQNLTRFPQPRRRASSELRQSHKAASPAFTKLCSSSWAVELPRSLITGNTFGAVIVYAAACAWREWGYTDDDEVFKRTAAAIPPGGWQALVRVAHANLPPVARPSCRREPDPDIDLWPLYPAPETAPASNSRAARSPCCFTGD